MISPAMMVNRRLVYFSYNSRSKRELREKLHCELRCQNRWLVIYLSLLTIRDHCRCVIPGDTAAKWVRMLRRFVIRAWIDYECSTSIAKFTPFNTIFFLLNKICDGGSSKEPFLKAATLSILIWAYPRETKTNNRNFKNATILPSKVAYRWRACALILPMCHPRRVYLAHAQIIDLTFSCGVIEWLSADRGKCCGQVWIWRFWCVFDKTKTGRFENI